MRKILAVAILVVSMLAVGCSNTQDLGMSFEEFKEKYNENVRREGLPSEYLIRSENIEFSNNLDEFGDVKGYCYFINFPNAIDIRDIFVTLDVDHLINCVCINVEPDCDYLRLYSLSARCFDDSWKDMSYRTTQEKKLLYGDGYTKGNYRFVSLYLFNSFLIKRIN